MGCGWALRMIRPFHARVSACRVSSAIFARRAHLHKLILNQLRHGSLLVREHKLREKDSNLQHPGSEPSVLPVELSLRLQLMGERLDSNQQPEAYEAPALPLSYAPEATDKSRGPESNRQPVVYETTALPIELPRLHVRTQTTNAVSGSRTHVSGLEDRHSAD